MYQKILVPVDGSSQSLSAVQHAINLALVSKAPVTLLHVLHDSSLFSDERTEERSGVDRGDVMSSQRMKAQEMLDKLKASYSDEEIKINTSVVTGSPAKEICKKAKIEGFDVIVIGSRGLGKIPGILMGSVSNKVCRGVTCPVIVIHAH